MQGQSTKIHIKYLDLKIVFVSLKKNHIDDSLLQKTMHQNNSLIKV